MDYLYRPVSYTPSRTSVGSDSKVRLILSHEDPGYHNWLDTQAFERGNLTYRNLPGATSTTFNTQLVKFKDLASLLPADTATVTAAQRAQQMHARFEGIRQRYVI